MKTLDQYRIDFESALARLDLDRSPASLYEPVKYILSLGGKRLRPTLVLAACDFCQGLANNAYHPAIGLELFHNFTLLHDDIMDQAPIRRGYPTVHTKWDINRAILSGDTMFALAGKMLLETHPRAVVEIQHLFFETAVEVCEGQQMDMDFEKQASVTTQEYLRMIGLKTAVLIAACLKTGALIAQAPAEVADSLYAFGYHCGIAFQLQDDFLDVFGDAASFGKATGGDIEANKKTWLYLKALEIASPEIRQQLAELYAPSASNNPQKVEIVKKIFTDLDISSQIRMLMQEFHDKALIHLAIAEEQFGTAPVLRAFAGKVIDRQV